MGATHGKDKKTLWQSRRGWITNSMY